MIFPLGAEGQTQSPHQIKQDTFNAKQGWLLDLDSNRHEKVLVPARTAGGVISSQRSGWNVILNPAASLPPVARGCMWSPRKTSEGCPG